MLTAKGEVQPHEEAQAFVHDLTLFLTVQLLDETPAVQSLGKLCEDHGYCSEWVCGQEPRFTKDGKRISCKTDNFVLVVVRRVSVNYGRSSSPTLLPHDSLRPETDQASGNRIASSSSSGSVFERSDEQATRRLGEESLSIPKKNQKDVLIRGLQRQSGEHRIACNRTQFSGIILETSCRSGNRIEEALY